jgi:glycosyltransferase involved in cell wall biosynthesis
MKMETKLVSIIVPCRNEEKFIGNCLDSIIAQDYSKDSLEVLVVDGLSEDRTRTIVKSFADRYPYIKLLDNFKKITSAALNIGIATARGDIIVWLSAHNEYEKNYITRSVDSLVQYGADVVGGIIRTLPREQTFIGTGIVFSLSHRFGIGSSYFRIHINKPRYVDAVFGGCYRRDIFTRVGLFNEKLTRGQDMEFNLRLKKAGGQILLVPDIISKYYARSDLRSFLTHNWINGVWAILPFLYSTTMPVSWRHLVPLAFILGLISTALLSIVWHFGLILFLSIVCMYSLANLIASLHIVIRERKIRYLLIMPIIFASLHISYGIGSLCGLFKVMYIKIMKFFRKRNVVTVYVESKTNKEI